MFTWSQAQIKERSDRTATAPLQEKHHDLEAFISPGRRKLKTRCTAVMGFYSVEQKGRKLQAKQCSYQVQRPHCTLKVLE